MNLKKLAAICASFMFTACHGGFQSKPNETADFNFSNSIFASQPTTLWKDESFSSQKFSATFDVVPSQTKEDAVIGFSKSAAAAYSDLAAIVRFNSNGFIDVRNGSTYSANSSVTYSPGQSFHFQMDINVSAHTYSVSVTPSGSAKVVLASNYAFRADQASVSSLSYLAKYSELGDVSVTSISVTLSLPDLAGPVTPAPAPSVSPMPSPAPSPQPTVSPSPAPVMLATYPDASNTGVPAGTVLTVHEGDWTITTNGMVIDAMDIRGALVVNADNVVVKRTKITNASWLQIQLNGKNDIVEDCEVDGTGNNNDGSYGILGAGTFLRNNIHGVENGITPSSNTIIQDNYVHDLKASGSPHYDGIQIDGGVSNIQIRHNTIINTNDNTSAVMMDNYFGPLDNIVVDNNYLSGGDFTVYLDRQFNSNPATNISITNNKLGSGIYGYFDFNKSSPNVSGNVDDKTGQPVN